MARGRFMRWVVVLGLATLLGVQAGAFAQEKSPTISMDVTEAYLEDVLKLLSKQSGMNFVASEAIRDKKVTLYFDRVPIPDALDGILKANNLALIPKEGKNLYVVDESGAPKVRTITRVYRLKYARVVPTAGELATTFGLSGSLIAATFQASSGSSGTTGAAPAPVPAAGAAGGAAGGTTGTSGQPAGILQIIKSMLTEHGSVVADPRTNSLIVIDIAERIAVIDETIAKLDVMPKQIFIEAEVLEVTLDTLRRIGLEYGDSSGTVGSYVAPKRTSFFPFSLGLLDAATKTKTLGTLSLAEANILFKLLATEKDVKFLARPRLLTLSNEVAEIRIVSEAVTGLTSTSQTQTGTVTSQPERTSVGTVLRVTPMVNDERYVTMIIEPEVSRVIQSSPFPNFLDPNRRLARTTVMVPTGGTAMIGGLISNENTNAGRRIPGLGDLPLLGVPFKRTETERKNTEILLFITPYILEDDMTDTKTAVSKEREQTPLTSKEEKALQGYRRRVLKERGVVETIETVAW